MKLRAKREGNSRAFRSLQPETEAMREVPAPRKQKHLSAWPLVVSTERPHIRATKI